MNTPEMSQMHGVNEQRICKTVRDNISCDVNVQTDLKHADSYIISSFYNFLLLFYRVFTITYLKQCL